MVNFESPPKDEAQNPFFVDSCTTGRRHEPLCQEHPVASVNGRMCSRKTHPIWNGEFPKLLYTTSIFVFGRGTCSWLLAAAAAPCHHTNHAPLGAAPRRTAGAAQRQVQAPAHASLQGDCQRHLARVGGRARPLHPAAQHARRRGAGLQGGAKHTLEFHSVAFPTCLSLRKSRIDVRDPEWQSWFCQAIGEPLRALAHFFKERRVCACGRHVVDVEERGSIGRFARGLGEVSRGLARSRRGLADVGRRGPAVVEGQNQQNWPAICRVRG